MILLELKRYIRQHHQVSLENILHHFDITEDAAQGLLAPLIQQGHILEISAASCSSGKCSSGCNSASNRYQWIEKKHKPFPFPIRLQVQ